MNSIASTPLGEIIQKYFAHNKKITSYWKKTGGILNSYAKTLNLTKNQITVIDIFDENSESDISLNLANFIKKTDKEKKYKEQLITGVRAIVQAVCHLHRDKSDSSDKSIVPEFFKPVMPYLWRNGKCPNFKLSERLNYSLSEDGQIFLSAVLDFIGEYNIESIESFFIDHRFLLYKKFRQKYPGEKSINFIAQFGHIARKMGFFYSKLNDKKSIALIDFPTKLQEQIDVFIKTSPLGLESEPKLLAQAAVNNIKIGRLEKTTVKDYLETICNALRQIKFEDYENVSIETFLQIEVEKQIDKSGMERVHLYNPYVEQYRKVERNKDSKYKNQGFDSVQFDRFLSALKSVAAFNGIFDYHELFRKAYKARRDKQSLKQRKIKKKKVFDLKWVDSEIERLSVKFRKIVKERSFKYEPDKRTFNEYRENLKFCFLYVQLVLFRFTGFRQQLVRNCEVGKNIVFNKDGSINCYWDADLVKNDQSYTANFDPAKHHLTHGLLLEGLNTYYKYIYPCISKNVAGNLNGQLFVCFGRKGLMPCKEIGASRFNKIFKGYINKFIDYGDRLAEVPGGLHAHFFRGLCGDWLYGENVPLSDIATILGDSEETVKQEYLDPARGYNINGVLDSFNDIARRKEAAAAARFNGGDSSVAEENKRLRAESADKDKMIEFLSKKFDKQSQKQDELIDLLRQKFAA